MQHQPRGWLKRLIAKTDQDFVPSTAHLESSSSYRPETIDQCAEQIGLTILPNDLTRMMYLASLRDCNSGRYLHPELTPRMGVEVAHQALFACHDQVFRHLLVAPMSEYVHQLEEYIWYTRAEKAVILRTWESLRAYRATVPMFALQLHCDLFNLNIEIALMILRPSTA